MPFLINKGKSQKTNGIITEVGSITIADVGNSEFKESAQIRKI